MSDPSIEVAKKCWTGFAGGMFTPNDPEFLALLTATREMAKSVQELHRPVAYINRQRCCLTCWDNNGKPHLWPCETAKRVYTSEELGL